MGPRGHMQKSFAIAFGRFVALLDHENFPFQIDRNGNSMVYLQHLCWLDSIVRQCGFKHIFLQFQKSTKMVQYPKRIHVP